MEISLSDIKSNPSKYKYCESGNHINHHLNKICHDTESVNKWVEKEVIFWSEDGFMDPDTTLSIPYRVKSDFSITERTESRAYPLRKNTQLFA